MLIDTKCMLQKDSDPTSKYWMPLHAAVATGGEEMVSLLISFGARVNLPNGNAHGFAAK